jgi:hypothetical protein
MFKAILFASVLCVATGCSKKEDKGAAPAADPKGAGGEAVKPTAEAPKPAAAPGKYTCDTILSKAIRDKFFAGHKIENIDFPVAHSGKCKITTPDGKVDFELSAACAPFMKNAKDQSIEASKKQFPDFKEVPGAGDITIVKEISAEVPNLMFTGYNKGSFCMASGTIPKAMDTTAFLTEWLASLPTS